MAEYFILTAEPLRDGCVIDRFPEGTDDIWQATEGVLLGSSLTREPLRLSMSKRIGGKAISDAIENTLGYLIISERVRNILESYANAAIEFVPVRLINHKGREEPHKLFIANILRTTDCVDREASLYEESALAPGQFTRITKLVLDPTRIDLSDDIFRIASRPRIIIVTTRLAADLRASGAVGLDLLPSTAMVNL
ncbi:DUF1629 domain-containing protein [Corallococcus sp. M34]|uniref:imm11 family protein n=1 Tax=Citreicoccus inhibens TaxID=2849499 RepID=UPI001C24AF68|nr:DUF1629 domain-containing protein [Citreicoccus inhibens]MBU8897877.1 DUF1629 domain-containing protein [Citreicoccus inhibens]